MNSIDNKENQYFKTCAYDGDVVESTLIHLAISSYSPVWPFRSVKPFYMMKWSRTIRFGIR